jgi:hypothetical protein
MASFANAVRCGKRRKQLTKAAPARKIAASFGLETWF